jgi:hypothetical protein
MDGDVTPRESGAWVVPTILPLGSVPRAANAGSPFTDSVGGLSYGNSAT